MQQLPEDVRQRLRSITYSGEDNPIEPKPTDQRRKTSTREGSIYSRSVSIVSQRRSQVSSAQEDQESILKQVKELSEKKKLIEEEKQETGQVS